MFNYIFVYFCLIQRVSWAAFMKNVFLVFKYKNYSLKSQ
ncbi:MAG: hypothetical protein BWY48_00179 [Parcubacteria group bacterium ADurb.Bin305]|nr:MAG: hypothetical protein BWY48_00179 [Parcubacteria group bacterium ADurb.Bin305]